MRLAVQSQAHAFSRPPATWRATCSRGRACATPPSHPVPTGAIVRINGVDYPFDQTRPAETSAKISALKAASYPPPTIRHRPHDGAVRHFPRADRGARRTALRPRAVRDHGHGRSRRRSSNSSRRASGTRPCRCPITSATAGSAGFCRRSPFAMVAQTGDIYYGLWYPIAVAIMTFIVGLVFIPETRIATSTSATRRAPPPWTANPANRRFRRQDRQSGARRVNTAVVQRFVNRRSGG